MLILSGDESITCEPTKFRNNSSKEIIYRCFHSTNLILKQFKLDKNKKIFLIIAAIFLIIIILVSIDIARRTTFPGSKGNLEQRILDDDKGSTTQEK